MNLPGAQSSGRLPRRVELPPSIVRDATIGRRQVLLAELTYRDGIHVLLDPTPEEVETARNGDLWQIWNSGRFLYLYSATGSESGLFEPDEDEVDIVPSARA